MLPFPLLLFLFPLSLVITLPTAPAAHANDKANENVALNVRHIIIWQLSGPNNKSSSSSNAGASIFHSISNASR